MCQACTRVETLTSTPETPPCPGHAADDRTELLGERFVDWLNGSMITLMISVGHRVGLFETMSRLDWATTHEIAESGGVSERYVREWLGAMVAADIVEHDGEAMTYRLPPAHAAALTPDAQPCLASFSQWVSVLGHVEDDVVEAFRHGRGVAYEKYHRFHEVMAEESDQTIVMALLDDVVPMVEGLHAKLTAGVEVLDVGCGSGRAMVKLAEAYPNSRFHGLDLSEEGVERARGFAEAAGVGNAEFHAGDAAAMPFDDGRFEQVFAFDAIHDQCDPAGMLAEVYRVTKPGGVFLAQDIQGSGSHAGDREHPVAPLIYTISTMHCMSVSLAQGGPGLGAAWGRLLAERMLKEAGFASVAVEELPHDIQNFYYVCRKG